ARRAVVALVRGRRAGPGPERPRAAAVVRAPRVRGEDEVAGDGRAEVEDVVAVADVAGADPARLRDDRAARRDERPLGARPCRACGSRRSLLAGRELPALEVAREE